MTLLRSFTPWQMILGAMLQMLILFLLPLGMAGALSAYNALAFVSVILLIIALGMFVVFWLLAISMFKVGFWWPLFFLLFYAASTILTYAGYFYHSGLLHNGMSVPVDFADAVYFSVTTWTTLGYGDFAPLEEMRLLTSAESLTGVLTAALTVAFVWAWSKDNIMPDDMTFLESNRVNASNAQVHRIRTRFFSGRRIPLNAIWLAITDGYEALLRPGEKMTVARHGPLREPAAALDEYPWKNAVTRMRAMFSLFGALIICAAILGAVGKFPLVGGAMLLLALFIFVYLVPFVLNFSRGGYRVMHVCLLLHFVATIFIYAMHYKWAFGDQHSFADALYFSFTTWATLGYGDMQPDEHMRLITSCEAVSGIFGISVVMSYVWHFCSEQMPSPVSDVPFTPDSHFRPTFGKEGKEWFGMGILIFPGWDKIPNISLTKNHRVMRWYPPLSEWEEANGKDLKVGDIIIVPSRLVRFSRPHPMDGGNSVFAPQRMIGVRFLIDQDNLNESREQFLASTKHRRESVKRPPANSYSG